MDIDLRDVVATEKVFHHPNELRNEDSMLKQYLLQRFHIYWAISFASTMANTVDCGRFW